MDRRQLADFLRVRRAALRPGDVGLPEGARRRTPGLRRQEVAQLAGISVEYYIRLEQARGPRPSRQVLGALARALMLDRDQRAHLYLLADESPERGRPAQKIDRPVLDLLGGLHDYPAYIVNAAYDVLAWNRLTERFMPFMSALAPAQRNILRSSFSGPDASARLADPAQREFLRACVADVRASLARNPADTGLRSLVDELLRAGPEFGAMWADHEVAVHRAQVKRIDHPELGPIEFACQVLEIPGSELRLIVYVPEPDSASSRAIAKLAAEVRAEQGDGAILP